MVFDTVLGNSNITSTKTDQSPLDDTKVGIFNAGARTAGTTVGVQGNYATCSGGDQNDVWNDYGTVPGGFQCTAAGQAAYCQGFDNSANADNCHVEGSLNTGGFIAQTWTLAAGGTTLTAVSNWTTNFTVGNTVAVATPDGVIHNRTIVAPNPAFGAGITTIHIDSALDLVSVSAVVANRSKGVNSHTEGLNNNATGDSSHAEGNQNHASGNFSHVEGRINIAQGIAAHAEGDGSDALGHGAHAEGLSRAWGDFSHSEGSSSNRAAWGLVSHVEGNLTGASDNAHVEGSECFAGYLKDSFTIAAGGVTVTIAGDVTAQYNNGDVALLMVNDSSHFGQFPRRKTIVSVPTFAAGNTTFDIASAIDLISTVGEIVDVTIGNLSHVQGRLCRSTQPVCDVKGVGAVSLLETESASAGGFFATAGDAQTRKFVMRGSTPGAAPNEASTLAVGGEATTGTTTAIPVESGKTYCLTVKGTANKMGVGAGVVRTCCAFYRMALISVRLGTGQVAVTGLTDVVPLITAGAAYVAALVSVSSPSANVINVTFAISGGNTAASRIVAEVELVEVLGT